MRQCDECKTRMSPYVPRRQKDGQMLCGACYQTPRGGYISAEAGVRDDDFDLARPDTWGCKRHASEDSDEWVHQMRHLMDSSAGHGYQYGDLVYDTGSYCPGCIHEGAHKHDQWLAHDHKTSKVAAWTDFDPKRDCFCGQPGHNSSEHPEWAEARHSEGTHDAWGRPLMKAYDGHGAWDCNNYNCPEHPQEMYDHQPGQAPGWMVHDNDPNKDVTREVNKAFHDSGTQEDGRYLLDQQHQGPTKFSSFDQESCPHNEGFNLHGQCKRCGYLPPTEADEPCDNEWCVEHEPEHTKGEHIDPPHLDPGHPDYHSAEQNIEDAIGEHPDGWLFDHNDEGPSKYSRKTATWSHQRHAEPIVHVMGQRPPRPLMAGDTLMHPDSGYSTQVVAHTPTWLRLDGHRTPVHREPMEGNFKNVIFGETADDRADMEDKLNVGTHDEHEYLKGNEQGPTKFSRKHASDDHEVLYHITDRHDFHPDPDRSPQDNAFAIQDRSHYKGLYVTDDPDRWRCNDYHRPYVAEVHVPHGLARQERWHGEKFIPAEHLDKVKVNRVMPFDQHQRERWGGSGTVEEYHGTPASTGDKDAREFTPEEHTEHLHRLRDYLHDVNGAGWNEFNDAGEHVGTDETDDEGMPVRRDRNGNVMTRGRSAKKATWIGDHLPEEPSLYWRAPNMRWEVHVKNHMPDRNFRENYGVKPRQEVWLHENDTSNPHSKPAKAEYRDGDLHQVSFGFSRKPPPHVMQHVYRAQDHVDANAANHEDLYGQVAEQDDIRSDLDRVPRDMAAEQKAHDMFKNLIEKSNDDDEGKTASLEHPTPAEGGEYEAEAVGKHLREHHGVDQDAMNDAIFKRKFIENDRAGKPLDHGVPKHDLGGIVPFITQQQRKYHDHLHATEDTSHEHGGIAFTKPVEDIRAFEDDTRPFKYGDPNRHYGEPMGDGGGTHHPWRDPSVIGRPKHVNPAHREPTDPTPNRVLQGHPNEALNGIDCTRTYPEHERNYPEKGSDDDPFHWHDQKMPYEEQERRRKGGWNDKYICSDCGAYKALHTGTEWNDKFKNRMDNLSNGGATAPFKPLPQSLNSKTARQLEIEMKYAPTARLTHRSGIQVVAHDSGDGETIYHCPFCGSGQVLARSDGTVECEFCHTAFTVQVQPEMSAFPQTINGVPVDVPGMPGEIGAEAPMSPMDLDPGAETGAPGDGGAPPAPGAEGDQDDVQGDVAEEEDDSKPPFLSSLRTEAGATLGLSDYLKHLTIKHAADRAAAIAEIRSQSNG
jgi:hypothetical protein